MVWCICSTDRSPFLLSSALFFYHEWFSLFPFCGICNRNQCIRRQNHDTKPLNSAQPKNNYAQLKSVLQTELCEWICGERKVSAHYGSFLFFRCCNIALWSTWIWRKRRKNNWKCSRDSFDMKIWRFQCLVIKNIYKELLPGQEKWVFIVWWKRVKTEITDDAAIMRMITSNLLLINSKILLYR